MKFQYFTFFLNRLNQKRLFGDTTLSKKEIIKEALTQKSIKYTAGSSHLAYLFVKEEGNFIIAKLGKKQSFKKSLPPEEDFEEKIDENWPHATIIFNIDDDPLTGQKIAFEYKPTIFPHPYEQLKDLAQELDISLFTHDYAIAISPLTKEQKFWDIIKQNEGNIEKVTFSFNAPNLFKLTNDLNDELKEAQEAYKLTKATVQFENPTGNLKLSEDDKFLREGVDYVTKGGGEYNIKIKNGRRVVKSKDNVRTETFEFEDLEARITLENDKPLLKTISEIFDRIKE